MAQTAKILDFNSALTQREYEDRLNAAEISAGWFFDHVTKPQKATYTETMEVLRGTRGPKWDRLREAAKAKWHADTSEARALYERSVEYFLANPGELLSEELDNEWTALQEREAVRHSMAAE